jgi:hypothetical protein
MHVPIEAVINLIRENLNDRYRRGFPVIKELIQNADDAGATRFDFGISPGLPQADHPLLHGPALFVVNDGNFTDRDAAAINSIGLSNKPAEHATIGKFGLGLKSIFHFCEAFFYLQSGHRQLRLVNPWAQSGQGGIERDLVHPEWNSIDDGDAPLVADHLRKVLTPTSFFCLWIPLRSKSHSVRNAAITEYYPGDTLLLGHDLFAPAERSETNLYQQSAALMPMLAQLSLIQHWECNGKDVDGTSFRVELQANSKRRHPPAILIPGQSRIIGGVLRIEATGTKAYNDLHFHGNELLLSSVAGLDALRKSNYWPKQTLTDSATFEAHTEADKAFPHAAVYFARYPCSGALPNLYVNKAVFLPVDDPERQPLAGFTNDIHLVLHGYFFVDAGRSRIEGLDAPLTDITVDDVRTLREQWNARLFQLGTLPLVLPSLAAFVKGSNLAFNQIEELTAALRRLRLFQDPGLRTALCSTDQWVCCVAPGSRLWQLLPTQEQVLPLPRPPDIDNDRPFAVLPDLKQIPYLTFDSLPRLSASDTLSVWDSRKLAAMLGIDVTAVFSSATKLDYLVRFLDLCPSEAIEDDKVQQRLLTIGCQAMAMLGPSALGKNRSLFARFYARLAPNRRMEMLIPRSLAGTSEAGQQNLADATDVIFKALANVAEAPLIVPVPRSDDAIDLTVNNTITSNVVHRLLAALESCTPREGDEIFADVITEIALRLLDRAVPVSAARVDCVDLHLFSGTIVGRLSETKRRLSLQELEYSNRQGKLFRFANPPKPFGLGRELGRALADPLVTLVKADTLKDLGLDAVGPCDLDGCLQLLKRRPSLSQIEDRLDLLRELLKQERWNDIDFVAAVRYLIHGKPDRYDDESPLIVTADGEGAWDLLMRRALAVRIDERWRIVPAEVVPELTPRARVPLRIQTLGPTNVAAMLKDFSDDELAAIDVSELDRSTLLLGVDSPRVLANLRIHRSVLGDYVVIQPGHTYLADDFDLPQTLSDGVVLLQRKLDHKLRQRYTEFLQIPPLNAAAVLTIALGKPNSHRFSGEIMDALAECGSDLRGALLTQVRETKWLPLPYCKPGFAAPGDIMHIPGMEEEIDRLLAANDVGYFDVLQIDAGIREHPAWERVCSTILPSADDAVDKLAIIVELAPEYHVGAIGDHVEPARVEEFVRLWRDGQVHTLQPVAVILGKLVQCVGSDAAARLWQSLCLPITAPRSAAILKHLRSRHSEAGAERRDQILKWFNTYLAAAAHLAGFADTVLPQVFLLNQRGDWRQTDCLCHGYVGIDRSDLVDIEQAKCLGLAHSDSPNVGAPIAAAGHTSSNAPRRSTDEDFAAGIDRLRSYFEPWGEYIADEPIGGFLCLLGDFPGMLNLAEKYLAPRHVTETRDALDWKPLTGLVAGAPVGGAGMSIHEALGYQRFTVDIVESSAKTQSVIALTGKPFEANLESLDDIQHLVVDDRRDPSRRMVGNWQVNQLRLRQVELKHFEPQRLTDLLGKTALHVLSHNYAQKPANFSAFWEDLLASEQLDIEVAQQWILDSIPHYLPMLGLRSDPDLGPLIKAWEELDLRKIETEHGLRIRGGQQPAPTDVLTERERIHRQLSAILIADGVVQRDIQSRVLTAMRRKIHDEYQYRIESVLFELFQNADDAVAELKTATGKHSALLDLYRSAVVELQDDALVFAHWGRAVNQVLVDTDGSASVGHRHDLVKMLALQTSDKQANGETAPLTGKFGLGFKTVYLLSDRPRILSGRLAFDIAGGIYPRRLVEDRRKLLEELRTLYTDGRQQRSTGTLIYLAANGGEHQRAAMQRALAAFSDLAPVTVVFARQIKQIDLRTNGQAITIAWRPRPVDGCPNLALGELQPAGAGKVSSALGLLLSSPDVALLLALGARGFEPLPKRIPTIWVTAPTQEPCALGFAVNAAFDLDVGRAQLARSSTKNQDLAEKGSRMLAGALQQLAVLARDWAHCCSALDLAANTTPYEFWNSLWAVLVEPTATVGDAEALRLLRIIVGSQGLGFQQLIQDEAVVPTQLPRQFQHLVKLSQVRYAADGIFENEDVLEIVKDWPEFQRHAGHGQLVHRNVARSLAALFADVPRIQTLSPAQLVRWESNRSTKIDPDMADRLGALITPKFMSGEISHHPNQLEELRDLLRRLEFRNQRGDFRPARDLLIDLEQPGFDAAEQDEVRRAAFAPTTLHLDRDYGERAQAFFRVCRERLDAPVETLVRWAFEADDDTRRRAVLDYCLHGELGDRVIAGLCKAVQFSYSWFQQLDPYHSLLQAFSLPERNYLLHRLGLAWMDDELVIVVPIPELQIGPTLENIYGWWQREGAGYLREYEGKTYPGGGPPLRDILEDSDHEQWRYAWLTLFVLGSSHTIGRVKPEVHRNFLQRCQERGWFDVFASPDAGADEWIGVLNDYLDDEQIGAQDFQYWHLVGKQFVSIYQLSRYLQEYVAAFRYLNRASTVLELTQILNLHTSQVFQGSGLDAPPIKRTLGLGACFVVRELVRIGVIGSPYAHSHCYVPVQRIRDCFFQLGCPLDEKPAITQSKEIFDFLFTYLGDRATFGGGFDIPFHVIHHLWGSIPSHLCVYQ